MTNEKEFENEIFKITSCFYCDGGLRDEEELKVVLRKLKAQILADFTERLFTKDSPENMTLFSEAKERMKKQILKENPMNGLTDEELTVLAHGEEINGDEIPRERFIQIRFTIHEKAEIELSRREKKKED